MGEPMETSSTDRPMMALAFRIGGIAALATMAALIKLAADRGVHIVEIIFWRQAISIPILVAGAMMMLGGISVFVTHRPKAHLMRSAYGLVGMVLNFAGVILLPLAEATTFSFTAPIWAVVLSIFLLGEKVGIWRWSAVLAGFVGILIIAQPGGEPLPVEGAAAALGGAFMVALISLQIRDLSRTEKPITIVFWFATLSTICVAPLLPFTMQAHDLGTYLLLLGIGFFGTVGQLLITAALRFGEVSKVIVMDYSALIWATLYGWLFFAVLPPAATWIGAPIIVLSGVIIAWRERVLGKAQLVARVRSTGT